MVILCWREVGLGAVVATPLPVEANQDQSDGDGVRLPASEHLAQLLATPLLQETGNTWRGFQRPGGSHRGNRRQEGALSRSETAASKRWDFDL